MISIRFIDGREFTRVQTKTSLSSLGVLSFISSSYLTVSFWNFPRIAVQHAGIDAFWAVLGIVVLGLPMAAVHGLLNRKMGGISGADMPAAAFGTWVGKFITFAFLPIYVLFLATTAYLFVESSVTPWLQNTPTVALVLTLVLVSSYGAFQGVEALARVASLIHPLTFIFITIVFFQGLFATHSLYRELPHTVTSLPSTFNGMYHLVTLYLGFSVLLMLNTHYPFRKNKGTWISVLSAALCAIVLLLAFYTCIATWGYQGTARLAFPIQALIRLLHIPGWLVERSGTVVVLVTTGYTTLFLSNHLWALSTTIARMVNLDESTYKAFIIPLSVVIVTVVALFDSGQSALDVVEEILVPASWIVLFVEPCTKLLIYSLKQRRQKT